MRPATCCLQAPAPSPTTSQLLATIDLAGEGLTAPLSRQQNAAIVQAFDDALGQIPGVTDIFVVQSQARLVWQGLASAFVCRHWSWSNEVI